jgi:hypothetical protein
MVRPVRGVLLCWTVGLCLARTFSVILNDQSVMNMFFLQDSCVDVLVVFLSLLSFSCYLYICFQFLIIRRRVIEQNLSADTLHLIL